MGLDFIHNTPGKPWRKGWAGGLDALKNPGLFDIDLKDERRLIMMDCTLAASIKAGAEVVVQIDKGRLSRNRKLASNRLCENPNRRCVESRIQRGGSGLRHSRTRQLFRRLCGDPPSIKAEPSPEGKPARSLAQDLWNDASRAPLGLGCSSCPDLGICGGLRTEGDLFSCLDFCCKDEAHCKFVCRHNPYAYVRRLREVGTLNLDSLPRFSPLILPALPDVVPFVGGNYGRTLPLDARAISVSLYDLINLGSGSLGSLLMASLQSGSVFGRAPCLLRRELIKINVWKHGGSFASELLSRPGSENWGSVRLQCRTLAFLATSRDGIIFTR